MAEIVDKAALGTLADDDELAIVQAGTTYRIQFSNFRKGVAGVDLQSLALGGTGADLSLAGGSNKFVRQSTAGATFTVDGLVVADLPVSSETAVGIIELATEAEVLTGTDALKTVTPDTLQSVVSQLALVGEVRLWTQAAAPSDWLLCDGSAVNRTTYADLFAVVGTTFGVGDGSTTFNLPDFRGSIAIGVDATYALAATGGAATHALSTAELASHTHETDDLVAASSGVTAGAITTYSAVTTSAIASAGGGGAHENLHPYLALNYIIYSGA